MATRKMKPRVKMQGTETSLMGVGLSDRDKPAWRPPHPVLWLPTTLLC